MNESVEALVYVCSSSLAELNTLLDSLEGADARTIEARLKSIESVAGTVSMGLDKLSKYMEELPPDDPSAAKRGPTLPVDDGGLLLRAAQVLCEAVTETE